MVTRETSVRAGLSRLGLAATTEQAEKLEALTALLRDIAVPRGFLGPKEGPRIISRHIIESAALLSVIDSDDGALVDVGSGAGLPGLVLAVLRGGKTTLIESMARRAAFLRDAARALGLPVEVCQARAEDAARGPLRDSAAYATARALAAPNVALELLLPFVKPDGRAVLIVGAADVGTDALSGIADRLGADPPRELRIPADHPEVSVLIVDKVRATPDEFPRRAGAAKRRPLT